MNDWVNPTGGRIRGQDPQGDGRYGAPRGNRTHTGTDYIGVPGQLVYAVIGGCIDRIGRVYSDDVMYRYVAITSGNKEVRELYVLPNEMIVVGRSIVVGQEIGTLQALHPRYRGIINHVHVDIRIDDNLVNPEDFIL